MFSKKVIKSKCRYFGGRKLKYILTAIYLFFTTSGIFLLKSGGDSLQLSFAKGIEFKINYITLLGFLCYAVSFILWQKLLVTYDLSYIVPLTAGLTQIIILFIGAVVFHERVNWISILGVIFIIIGVTMLTYVKK